MLLLGTAKVEITPSRPIPLAGFASRREKGDFEGVSHPLYARILCFQHQDAEGKLTSAVLISADLLWWGGQLVPQLHARIRERWSADEVILHATHTHSGPQTADYVSVYLGEYDADYAEELIVKVLAGVDDAVRGIEAVTAEIGRGECAIAMNRRQTVNGEVHIGTNPDGPVDKELTVIRYLLPTGREKAVLVHYACHPVVTRDNLISSEFTGVAMDELERSIGDQVVCAYLQGCCGDINPMGLERGNGELVIQHGQHLAEDVRKVLHAPMKPLSAVALRSARLRIELPLQPLPDKAWLESQRTQPDVIGEWSSHLLASTEPIRTSTPFEAAGLVLADEAVLLTMNAEIMVAYGLLLKSLSNKHIIPLGYSDGMIGYIPTAAQLSEGGYEPMDSTYYFRLPAPFDPVVEQMLCDALLKLYTDLCEEDKGQEC